MLAMQQRNNKWFFFSICALIVIGFLFVSTIVLSLIPIYISSNTVPSQQLSSSIITLSYNISANALNISLPVDALPETALKILQTSFQKKVDADSPSAGTSVTVAGGNIQETSSEKKKRQSSSGIITLIVYIQLIFPRSCSSKGCENHLSVYVVEVILKTLDINYSEFQDAILANQTTTTTAVTAVTVSGGTGSYSPSPSPSTTPGPGGRRRRSIIQSPQSTSHMPIGGCLVIGTDDSSINLTRYLYKKYAFVKHLPLGVKSILAIDGQQIDLNMLLHENKLSRSIYNQLVTQDRPVSGHYLTLGSLGCLESHVRAWQRVVEVNKPMLILEDDVHLNEELFDYILPYLLYALPTNFSLLYFGNLVGKDLESKLIDYNDLLWKIDGSNWGTYAYLISPQGAATLLDFIYPIQSQVDSMIIDIAQSQSLNVFMSKQILVNTDNKHRRASRTQRYLIPPIVIPRILHFIWLNNNSLPAAAQRNIQLWRKLHPNWQIRLWTNTSDLTIYNKDRFENSARSARQASDILRYEIIYQYGGIYADVDFEPLKNIEPFLHGVQAFVAYESEQFICNGFFGAVPGHQLTERLVTKLESSWIHHKDGSVNEQTGPYHMTRQVNAMKEEKQTTMKDGFQMFARHLFFPYAWYESDPGHPYNSLAYAVHHFRPMAEIEQDAKDGH